MATKVDDYLYKPYQLSVLQYKGTNGFGGN